MSDPVQGVAETPDNRLLGCSFDAATAKALNGKSIVAMVTSRMGKLLAVAGQQGLSFNMSAETKEAATKDDSTAGWAMNFHGSKSWDASIDGLYSPDDEATQMVAKALANDEYLCLKVVERVPQDGGVTKYVPLRMGMAVVTADNFEAPNDDNATYSMDFTGNGKPWLRETATAEEIEAASWLDPAPSASENEEG